MHPYFRRAFQFFWSELSATRPPFEEIALQLFSMRHSTTDKALVLDFDQRHLAFFNPKKMEITPDKDGDLASHLLIASRDCPTSRTLATN